MSRIIRERKNVRVYEEAVEVHDSGLADQRELI